MRLKRLSKGELNQLEKTRKLDMNETDYFSLISDKTAALISSCSELGALTAADQSPEYRQAMKMYGEYLGIAFQIKDDLLDYQSNMKILGKPAGADLKESKLTLPMIYALSQVSDSEAKSIIKKMKKGLKSKQIRDVIQFVVDQNGIEYAYEKARDFGRKAKNELSIFPDSQYRAACLSLVDYVIERRK